MTLPTCEICGVVAHETESGRLEITHDYSRHIPRRAPETPVYGRNPDRPLYGGRNDE